MRFIRWLKAAEDKTPREKHGLRAGLICVAIALASVRAHGQTTVQLDTVKVSVTRDSARSPLSLPFALSVSLPHSARPGGKHASLDETLSVIPGLFAASRQNPAQDPRVSIRGFGSRSAFGIRGVRVLWEGIPLTVADGQTPVDYVDLDAVDRVEVIRGSASALYGNSSGGVISLSEIPASGNELLMKHWQENAAMRRTAVRFRGTTGSLAGSAGVSRTGGSGFRSYSRIEATRASGGVRGVIGGSTLKLHLSALSMPTAENPGSLTDLELRKDPRGADPLSVRKNARKAVDHTQIALSLSRPIAAYQASASVYGGARRLVNPLAFATVHLDRSSGGASARISGPFRSSVSLLTLGADAQLQNDDRHEFENCSDVPASPVSARCPSAGRPTGALRRDQREIVTSVGAFIKAEYPVEGRTTLTAGGRADQIHLRVRDRAGAGRPQDQSGSRLMNAVSPLVGVVLRLRPALSIYVNGSTAFETPTASELANKPDGTTGLNPSLNPQSSRTAEAGIKGFHGTGIRYDVAAFITQVRDELVPFEIPSGGGRRFFRNAGRTRRGGLEASAEGEWHQVTWNLAYTASRFSFAEYSVGSVNYAGRRIPGIPASRLDAAVIARARRVYIAAETLIASSTYLNDSNDARSPGYQVANIRLGFDAAAKGIALKPVIGVSNLFNERYSMSTNINAAGGKYYEPAPERLLYGMVRLERRF